MPQRISRKEFLKALPVFMPVFRSMAWPTAEDQRIELHSAVTRSACRMVAPRAKGCLLRANPHHKHWPCGSRAGDPLARVSGARLVLATGKHRGLTQKD